MCSCNDDLFVERDTNGISVSDETLQPSGGKTYVRFEGCRYNAPSVEIAYVKNNVEIQMAFETVTDRRTFTYADIFSMSAEYDESRGQLEIDLDYSLIATDVIIRVRHSIISIGPSESLDEIAEIEIKPSAPAKLTSFSYSDTYTVASNPTSRSVYNFVNSADTSKVFKLPEFVRPTSMFFKFKNPASIMIFGDEFPDVNAAIVENGKVTVLDQLVTLDDLRQSFLPGGELDDRYREFTAPPRTLLQVGITFIETGYSIPFTGYADAPSVADIEHIELSGIANVSEHVVDTVGYRYLDLETGEEVIP